MSMTVFPPDEKTRMLINALGNGRHPEVPYHCRFYDVPEADAARLAHMCNTTEVERVRLQLDDALEDVLLSLQFGSFLVHPDPESGLFDEIWGVPTTILWPDSCVFRII